MRARLTSPVSHLLAAAALIACALSAQAAPGDDIGSAVRVINLVTGTYEQDHRDLSKGDPVRQDELIEVGDDGIGELLLRDDTKLALGPGSRLLLDQFVYKPDIDGGAIVLNLVRGAFRFITGIAAKPAYVIKTPTAAITVRGTIFDVYIEPNGRSWLLLIDGGIEACNERATCVDLDEPGKLLLITPDGELSQPRLWTELDTDGRDFAKTFPFVETPPEVDPDPIFTPGDIVDARPGDDGDDGDTGPPPGDNGGDDGDDNAGGGPRPDPGPPLTCWRGWKRVNSGFDDKGWRVKKRYRNGKSIYCARRTSSPPIIVPPPGGKKPKCVGGKLISTRSIPPQYGCVCPNGRKRLKVGRNSYLCLPIGGGKKDPKKECLKKGWRWTGSRCVPPPKECPRGYSGKPPHCHKIVNPPKRCPRGYTGKPPKCKKITHKPTNKLRDVQKTIKKLQQLQRFQKMQRKQHSPSRQKYQFR